MTKVIRKYKTWLLAIFGIFLMVTFLFSGPTNPFMPDPRKRVTGTLSGEKVRVSDLAAANTELQLLRGTAPELLNSLNIEEDDPMHWFMLTREATRMGLVGTYKEGVTYISRVAETRIPAMVFSELREQYPQFPPSFLEQLTMNQVQNMPPAERAERIASITTKLEAELPPSNTLNYQELGNALARLRGVERMMTGYIAAARMSDKRLVSVARDFEDVTLADIAFVKATQFVDDSLTFTEEQIAAQWEKYKNTTPGAATAENPFGFGYIQPPRVKFEYITLELAAIENAITLDPVDINKQWQLNRAKFPGDFATERPRIERELRMQRADTIMLDAERAYQAAVRSSVRGIEIVDGVKRLPADWASRAPSMQSLAESVAAGVKASAKLSITTPVVTSRTSNWTRVSDAANTAGIGNAGYSSGASNFGLSDLLAGTYELSDSTLLGVQKGVAFEGVLKDQSSNAYFFLVTDIRKTGPADTLDEVRDQIVTDLRQQAAYEALASRIEGYRAQVATEGLDATIKAINASMPAGRAALDSSVLRSQQFSRKGGGSYTEVSDPQPLRDAIAAAGSQLGLAAANDANLATRAVAVALPADRVIALSQVVGVSPVTVERMRRLDARLAQNLAASQLGLTRDSSPFTLANMKKRLQWTPEGDEQESSEQASR
jgi:hypothetical protein